ncbi:GntR family transcriptional regulator [Terribacillus sp. 179-K 1B1 HS]|uniref:GntR family transcriptional regulator n=1 Tax=Terribacillus sp. 179-K 1B1 HS TaxID=3142388 RepID=UPI0039A3C96A
MKSTPLYRQIANEIKKDIARGYLKKDEAIPTEMELAASFQASRVTVRQALQLLVKEDLLYKVHGSGTYVKQQKIEHDIYRLQSFTEEIIKLGKVPSNKLLTFTIMHPEEEIRRRLQLSSEAQVFYVKRLRCADDDPIILEETFMPIAMFPDLTEDIMMNSKYAYLESKGFLIKERMGEMIPAMPSPNLMKLLEIEETAPILSMQLWAFLENDIPFEYTRLYYRSDRYTFKFSSKRY